MFLPKRLPLSCFRRISAAVLYLLAFTSCGGSYDDTIAGVVIPVPKAMSKTSDAPVEMKLFGFGMGQASYRGKIDSDAVVEFYKKELPARGWQPNASLQSGGAMLTYSKEGRTVLVTVGKQDNETRLILTVGGSGR